MLADGLITTERRRRDAGARGRRRAARRRRGARRAPGSSGSAAAWPGPGIARLDPRRIGEVAAMPRDYDMQSTLLRLAAQARRGACPAARRTRWRTGMASSASARAGGRAAARCWRRSVSARRGWFDRCGRRAARAAGAAADWCARRCRRRGRSRVAALLAVGIGWRRCGSGAPALGLRRGVWRRSACRDRRALLARSARRGPAARAPHDAATRVLPALAVLLARAWRDVVAAGSRRGRVLALVALVVGGRWPSARGRSGAAALVGQRRRPICSICVAVARCSARRSPGWRWRRSMRRRRWRPRSSDCGEQALARFNDDAR